MVDGLGVVRDPGPFEGEKAFGLRKPMTVSLMDVGMRYSKTASTQCAYTEVESGEFGLGPEIKGSGVEFLQ